MLCTDRAGDTSSVQTLGLLYLSFVLCSKVPKWCNRFVIVCIFWCRQYDLIAPLSKKVPGNIMVVNSNKIIECEAVNSCQLLDQLWMVYDLLSNWQCKIRSWHKSKMEWFRSLSECQQLDLDYCFSFSKVKVNYHLRISMLTKSYPFDSHN